MRKCLLLFPMVLMFCVSSCGTVERLNDSLNDTTNAIYCNIQAVQESTYVIRENAQLVDASTRSIAENKRLLEAVSH